MATFAALEQEYFVLYTKIKTEIFNEEPLSLDEALDRLDQEVSTTVTHKVTASKCLAGLPQQSSDMLKLLESNKDTIGVATSLQDGCVQVIAGAYRAGWKLCILSINWSQPLVDAVLLHPIRQHLDNVPVEAKVWCNSVDAEGCITLKVPGARAKRDCIAALRQEQDSCFVVYVGDSSTDLLGLLEANVGVLFGNSNTVAAIAEKWKIRLAPLAQRQHKKLDPMDESTVWVAQDWMEVEKLLTHIPAS
jgi:phosphoglycolate phosphatase-like HAD superfamily hydrolase